MLLANETVAAHLERAQACRRSIAFTKSPIRPRSRSSRSSSRRWATRCSGPARPSRAARLPEARGAAFTASRKRSRSRSSCCGRCRRRGTTPRISATSASRRRLTRTSRRRSAGIPDLVVHRVLRESRRGMERGAPDGARRGSAGVARHTSERERRANEAERELVQWKKVRFMADKVGDEFDGLHHRRQRVWPLHRARGALRRRHGARLDDGGRLLPVRGASAHPARREERPRLPAGRSRATCR